MPKEAVEQSLDGDMLNVEEVVVDVFIMVLSDGDWISYVCIP